jgi:WhiB family redox-sensing transcriptional regulator
MPKKQPLDLIAPIWPPGANCAGQGDRMYPDQHVDRWTIQRTADEVCGPCPIRAECLEWALTRPEEYGIWGGTTVKQRRRMVIERRRAARRLRIVEGPEG